MNNPALRATYRTECNIGRASYHPEWSKSMPWALYLNGTATRHAESLQEARDYFAAKGLRLKEEPEPVFA
jgi:hypothetical protein